MSIETLKEYLPFLIPLILLEVILLIVALRDVLKHEHYKHGTRLFWVIFCIVGMEFIGPILYFVFGKDSSNE